MKPPGRPRFSTRDMLVITAAAAFLCRFTASAYLTLPIIALACPRSSDDARRYRLVFSALAYLPALIGFWLDCAHCKDAWIRFGGVVPGGSLLILLRRLSAESPLDGPVAFGIAACVTLVMIVAGAAMASRGRGWAAASGISVLAMSSLAYAMAFTVIRM